MRNKLFNLAIVLSLVFSVTLSLPAMPVQAESNNDYFSEALDISSLPFTYGEDKSTSNWELEWIEPSCYCSCGVHHSIWFKFTPLQDGLYNLNTQFSNYDNEIAVFTYDEWMGFLNGQTCTTSRNLEVNLFMGITYYIRIASLYDDAGWLDFQMNLVPPPENDNFDTALVISELPSTYLARTNLATLEPSEPSPSCLGWGWNLNSVWYKFTPANNLQIQIFNNVGDPRIAVYTGDSINNLIELGCGGYWLGINVDAEVTYYFQVLGYTTGEVYFSIPETPDNDDRIDAIDVTDGYSSSTWIFGATTETDEPYPTCLNSAPQSTIWYRITSPAKGMLWFSTYMYASLFAGFKAVFFSDDQGILHEVGCDPGLGQNIPIYSNPGETYYLQIGSQNNLTGYVHLNVGFTPSPANDDFLNAEDITELPFSDYTPEEPAATFALGEPQPSCYQDRIRTVWYKFTSTNDGAIVPASTYDTYLAIYTGEAVTNLSEVYCRSSWSPVPLKVQAGETYYFQIALPGIIGYLNFDLRWAVPPSIAFVFNPSNPSMFDSVAFENYSYDPEGYGFESLLWNFGDGSISNDWSPTHIFTLDGDYNITLSATTIDGRVGTAVQTVLVRTHDISIARFSTPVSAKVGQTRTLTLSLNNHRYPERVLVEIFKSTPYGYISIGSIIQYIPIRPAGRTTSVSFNYTFAPEDAVVGKITFKAVVNLQDATDALPADNEVISFPVTVK